jgi:NADPH-dependent F420 reductase
MNTVAVIGGTGFQGKGLGYRFSKAGHEVILGSRSEDRAGEAAAALESRDVRGAVRGTTNAKAAEASDLVLLAVPYDGHNALVKALAPHPAGKTVISCVTPLGFDRQGPFALILGPTSAAEIAQTLLPDSLVVGAFATCHAAALLGEADLLHHEDVLVCGDDKGAKQKVIDLAATVTGKPGIDAGPLRLARQLEPLTAVLISVNERYKVRRASPSSDSADMGHRTRGG